MKWKEMSASFKVISVIGFLCAGLHFVMEILGIMDILTDFQTISYAFWSIFDLSQAVLLWKYSRKSAIFWLSMAGAYLLLGAVYLFI